MINYIKWMSIFTIIHISFGLSIGKRDVISDVEAFETFSSGLNLFSTEFYQQVSKNETKNIICSPLSVAMVLMMAEYGADGKTAQEINLALHSNINENIKSIGINKLIDKLNDSETLQLRLANKMFIDNNLNIKSNFKAITKNTFKSEAESLNFTDAEEASKTINKWCELETNSQIKDLVQPEDLNSDTSLIMLNAVYFKGSWAHKFNTTEERQFYVNENTNKTVAMMNKIDFYRFGLLNDLNAKFVEIPYESSAEDGVSMIIILPNEVNGLSKVESELHNLNFNELLAGTLQEVNLSVPKFKVKSEIDLKNALVGLKMKDMFEDSANFSRIVDSPLKVSKIIQKAFIEVNEEGSEAAAATEFGLENRIGIEEYPLNFEVDHPFLLVIMKKNIIFFFARVINL